MSKKSLNEEIIRIKHLMNVLDFNLLNEQSMGGMSSPTAMSDPKRVQEFGDFIKEYRHGILQTLAIGTLFIPLVGPFISLGLELSDAALYLSEGDKEMAGLGFAFALIPGGEIIKNIRGVKGYSKKFILNAFKKAKSGKPLTGAERKVIVDISNNVDVVKRLSKQNALIWLIKNGFNKLTFPQKIGVIYKLGRQYKLFNLTRFGITIGGIYYSYDKLAKIFGWVENVEGDVNKSKEIESIKTSENDKEMESFLNEIGRDEKYQENIMNSLTKVIKDVQTNVPKIQNKKTWINSPSEDLILNGNGVVKIGMKGNIVKKIQKFLRDNDYDLGNTGPSKDGVDGYYLNKTYDAVKNFQRDSKLKLTDGIVGKETYNKMFIENIEIPQFN